MSMSTRSSDVSLIEATRSLLCSPLLSGVVPSFSSPVPGKDTILDFINGG